MILQFDSFAVPWYDIIVSVAVPLLTSVVGYYAGRHKRRNDFLQDLQESIEKLSEYNTKLIDDVTKLNKQLVDVKAENAKLSSQVQTLQDSNQKLTEQVEQLTKSNADLNTTIEGLQEQLNGVKTITRYERK
jgi:septal ring factor EnvC (AmiA/AmiB activator)